PTILARQLAERLAPDSRLRRIAAAYPGLTIDAEGEDHPLPNPFALVLDPSRTDGIRIPAFVGKAHGDLHIENILIPSSLRNIDTTYQLIDLSRYAADAVLTRDPVHLVLHILARTLSELSAAQRTAVIDLLLDPEQDGDLVPRWLFLLIDRVRSAAEDWARRAGLVDLWRDQIPLSLLAVALTCLGRASTRPEDQGWFLRLAANSAAVFLGRHHPDGRHHPGSRHPDRPRGDWHNPDERRPAETAATAAVPPEAADQKPAVVRPSTPQRPGQSTPQWPGPSGRYDFFISYAQPDEAWADWIAWQLEEAGCHLLFQAGDGTDGPPRITMRDGARHAHRTLVLLSPAYLSSVHEQREWWEWRAALDADDPTGPACRLVTVLVEACAVPAAFDQASSAHVDLSNLAEADARKTLLQRLTER
ncbi:toll/interleukin-1 receptor domain-containing protein, partial [Frankia sp. CcWB2]